MPCSYCNKYGHNIRTCNLKSSDCDWKGPFSTCVKNLKKELNVTKKKLGKMNKAFEELAVVNQQLHQEVIDNNDRSEKWAIQSVLAVTKFKFAMKTIQTKLIKNSATAPENDIFDCPACMEKQTIGIQCTNNHKLCLRCSCQHLYITNQACPMCRDSYIKDDVRDVAKEAGVQFSPRGNGIGLELIVPPVQFKGNIRRAIFEIQQPIV